MGRHERSARAQAASRWRRANFILAGVAAFALFVQVGPARSSVTQTAVHTANGNNGNGNGNGGGDDDKKKTTTTTSSTTTTKKPTTTTTASTTTTKKPTTTTTTIPCKDVDTKKYPPKPCKPKCNSGRGNGSETKPNGDDCDPGNSGGHNNGGG